MRQLLDRLKIKVETIVRFFSRPSKRLLSHESESESTSDARAYGSNAIRFKPHVYARTYVVLHILRISVLRISVLRISVLRISDERADETPRKRRRHASRKLKTEKKAEKNVLYNLCSIIMYFVFTVRYFIDTRMNYVRTKGLSDSWEKAFNFVDSCDVGAAYHTCVRDYACVRMATRAGTWRCIMNRSRCNYAN